MAKLFRLLKPGGYLQWAKPDFDTMHFDKSQSEGQTDLLELLSEAGLVDVERDARDPPPQLALLFCKASLMIHELIARKTENQHLASEHRRLLPGAVEKTRQGAYGTTLTITVTGRKP